MKAIPDILKNASRELRKNMTETEKILWNKLKARKFNGIKFQRQTPIYVFTENSGLDRYIIPDFICSQYKLIIEIDGSIHELNEVYILDKVKEKILKSLGYKVIRFKNNEITENIEIVLRKIKENFN